MGTRRLQSAPVTASASTKTAGAVASSNEAGYIYISKDKKDRQMLKIKLGDELLHGFAIQGKSTEKAPDFRIVSFASENESILVGSAWNGTTGKGREKLTLKINNKGYFTAFLRDVKAGQSEKRADMTIFDNSGR